jgi:hypothetical protein
MECSRCNEIIGETDAIQCAMCLKFSHINCVGISEAKFRKMSKPNKSQWKCPTCTQLSSLPSTPTTQSAVPEPTLQLIMNEIKSIQSDLKLFKSLKDDLSDLKTSMAFINNKFQEQGKKNSII